MNSDINPEVCSFLEEYHLGSKIKDIAEVMRVTPQAMSQMLRRGMLLSSAERIAAAYGYSLELIWPKKTYPNDYVPEYCPTPAYEAKGNLRGLAQYINDARMTLSSVAKNAGISPATLCRSLASGDISITKMKRVADSIGISPEWRWVKKY